MSRGAALETILASIEHVYRRGGIFSKFGSFPAAATSLLFAPGHERSHRL